MRIAKVTELCRLEDKVNFIFVIKELLGSRTNKAGAILVYFNGKRQTLGTKAMATSQMEKQIEIRLKDISKGTEEEIYRDKLVGIPPGRINRNSGGHSSGILISWDMLVATVPFSIENYAEFLLVTMLK